jgi:hypothetical protein
MPKGMPVQSELTIRHPRSLFLSHPRDRQWQTLQRAPADTGYVTGLTNSTPGCPHKKAASKQHLTPDK